jgi:hypothetical protein
MRVYRYNVTKNKRARAFDAFARNMLDSDLLLVSVTQSAFMTCVKFHNS